MKVVLLGPNGQLGHDIRAAHAEAGEPFELVPLGRDVLDVTDPDLEARLMESSFDVLVNCTGYHKTDEVEDNAALAFAVNAHAVQRMARACERRGARLVHVSTDYVFGGDTARTAPLREDDPIAPVNVYGASKALGETLARLACEDAVVLRVASLFGVAGASGKGGNFVETMLQLARERGTLTVVDDQVMSPTATADVARVVVRLLSEGCEAGCYHLVNSGAATWCGFAREIVRQAGVDAEVTPCTSEEFPKRAARPRYSVLDNRKVLARFGGLGPWEEALERYVGARGQRGSWKGASTPASPSVGAFVLGQPVAADSAFDTTETLYRKVGNTGNLAFARAIYEHLGGESAGVDVVEWSATNERVEGAGRVGVIPAANQLGRHTDFAWLARRWSDLDVRMVMIGLGAQGPNEEHIPEVSEGTLRWIEGIANHAPADGPNIGVRGAYSLRVLEHFGLADRATVLGCPSLFLSPNPSLGRDVADRMGVLERVAVVAGHFGWKRLWRLEASLAKLVDDSHGSYVGQAPLEMVMLTRGEADQMADEALSRCRDFICPDMSLPSFAKWSREHGNVFFDISPWLEHYRRFDIVVGTRIHGTLLALQAGVPALCIAHDVRTTEMCRTMGLPFVSANDVLDGVTREQVAMLVRERFDPDAFDANRLRLCSNYAEFLRNNTIEPVPWLVALARAAAQGAARTPD